MSDPFVDALHERLMADAIGVGRHGHDRDRDAALAAWWEEFVDVLGQKVGAWNERQAPAPPINFTRQASGAVHVWHRSAEATFTRDRDAIQVSTRVGEARRDLLLAMRIAAEGTVVAVTDGNELPTPTAAAEHLLTPLLIATFVRP